MTASSGVTSRPSQSRVGGPGTDDKAGVASLFDTSVPPPSSFGFAPSLEPLSPPRPGTVVGTCRDLRPSLPDLTTAETGTQRAEEVLPPCHLPRAGLGPSLRASAPARPVPR